MAITTGKVNMGTTEQQLMPVVSCCVAAELAKLKIPMMGEDFQTKLNYLQELQSLCLHEKLQFLIKKIDKLEQDFNIESLRKSEQMREHNEILQRQTAVIEEFALWRFYLDQEHVNMKRTLQAMYEDQKGIQTIQDRMVTEQCKIKKELNFLYERSKVTSNVGGGGPTQICASSSSQQQHQELANKFLYLNSETTKLGLNLERVKSWQIEFGHQMKHVEGVMEGLRSKVDTLSLITPDLSRMAVVDISEERRSDRIRLRDTKLQLTEVSSMKSYGSDLTCGGSEKFEISATRMSPSFLKDGGYDDDTENLVSEVVSVCEQDDISDVAAISEKDGEVSQCSVDAVPDLPPELPAEVPIPAVVVTEASGSEDSDNHVAQPTDAEAKEETERSG